MTKIESKLDDVSFIVLCVLVALSPFSWLPVISNNLHDFLHLVFGAYVVMRGFYHVYKGSISLPISPITVIPAVLTLLFVPKFHDAAQIGNFLNFVLSIVFFYLVLLNFTDPRFDNRRFKTLLLTFSMAVFFHMAVAFSLYTQLLPPIHEGLPFPCQTQCTTAERGLLGFTNNPIEATTLAAFGLIYAIIGTLKSEGKRVTVYGILGVGSLLYVLVVFETFFGSGRTGVLLAVSFISLLVASQLLRRTDFQFVVAASSPLLVSAYVIAFVVVRVWPAMATVYNQINTFTSGRLALWDNGVRIVFAHPTGIGFDRIQSYLQPPAWSNSATHVPYFGGVQSLPLTIAVGFGIVPGLITIFWLTLCIRRAAMSFSLSADQTELYAAGLFIASSLAAFVGSFTGFTMYKGLFWWVALAGLVTLYRNSTGCSQG